MFRPLSLFVGLRYSRAKYKNKFVSFISIASILGISLGVMVLIIGLSAMNGFEKALRDQLLSVIPHGELEVVNGSFNDIDAAMHLVQESDHIIGATPYISLSGLLQKDSKMKALQIRAINPDTEGQVTDIEKYIDDGGWSLLKAGEQRIILGKSVADNLGISIGQSLSLLLPQPSEGNKLKAPRVISLTLTGLFEMGGQIDSTIGFIHIEDAKRILNMENPNAIAFKVDNILDAQQISRVVGYQLPEYMYIKSWITSQGYLYQDIQMVKSLMYVILLLVVAVACFNIVSTLVMAVNEKRGDIAILKTMGASNAMLRLIFIVQGAFNGLVGSLFGALAGCYIALNLTHMITLLEKTFSIKILSGDIYFIDFLPSELDYHQVLVVTLSAFIMSVLATLYPAWSASKIQPARELGYSH